jgi:hypothetical protein
MQKLKETAKNNSENSFNIVSENIAPFSAENKAHLVPSLKSMRDLIKKERNKIMNYVPGVLLDMPEKLKKDSNGNLFLRFDSGYEDNNRILIFITEFKFNLIKNLEVFEIDGTFRSSPSGFYQLLVIHG